MPYMVTISLFWPLIPKILIVTHVYKNSWINCSYGTSSYQLLQLKALSLFAFLIITSRYSASSPPFVLFCLERRISFSQQTSTCSIVFQTHIADVLQFPWHYYDKRWQFCLMISIRKCFHYNHTSCLNLLVIIVLSSKWYCQYLACTCWFYKWQLVGQNC